MTNEFQAKLIEEFAHEMARRIGEAVIPRSGCRRLREEGPDRTSAQVVSADRALLFEASRIMSAGLIVHRRDCDRVEYV